jgi:8-oxo-dGTP diphosphatase
MPNYDEKNAHYIVVTGVIVKDGKYLIAQRSLEEKAFPGEWTVPGGKFDTADYMNRPKDTSAHWYNVLENLLKREVKEEVNLEIEDINYITSLVYVRSDNIPTLIVSLYANYKSGEVKLCKDLIDYKWVTFEELKDLTLIEGIHEEIEILDKKLKGKKTGEWAKKS